MQNHNLMSQRTYASPSRFSSKGGPIAYPLEGAKRGRQPGRPVSDASTKLKSAPPTTSLSLHLIHIHTTLAVRVVDWLTTECAHLYSASCPLPKRLSSKIGRISTIVFTFEAHALEVKLTLIGYSKVCLRRYPNHYLVLSKKKHGEHRR